MKMSENEGYLIDKVVDCLKTDKAAAKAWMIFSKSVFSQSFPVLFQSYKMECEQKNLQESAVCLTDLIKKFSNEPLLIRELRDIANVLYSDNNDFLKQIFEKLPDDIKYEVMLSVTRNAQTIEEHCELMLLFLKRMPNSRLLQHGGNIIDTLLAAEERQGIQIPVNLFRKMLVCDALPLILKVSQCEYKFKAIFQLLQKAVEFYVCCIMSFPLPQEAAVRNEVISNSESIPDENWKPLMKLLEIIAIRYRWSHPEMLTSSFNELSLQQLLSLLKRRNKTLASLYSDKHRRDDHSGYEEAYFCLIVTFFYYLYNFGRIIHPKIYTSSPIGPHNYILMEGIAFPQEECPDSLGNSFKKTERGYLVISKDTSRDADNMLIPSFVTAAECWELLHRHSHLMKEFDALCKNIKLDTWPVFQEFYIDLLMYQGAHMEAIDHLNQVRENATDPSHKNRAALQIASCCHFSGDYERSLKILFDVINSLTPTSTYESKPSLSKCPSRYMYFMDFSNKQILQYCVAILLKLYKCKENVDEAYKDMTLGYLFILMQYDLDREFDLFHKCVDKIKKSKNFSFQKFFNYIINVDILEELSYLATPTGGNINLDILLTPTFQASKQRAVTRGVNRGARDDLKQAFINQMVRCYDNLDNLYIEFFKEEHSFLLLTLTEMYNE